MDTPKQLTRLKPMVVALSSAYAMLGLLLSATGAHAADTINPANTTITTPLTLGNTYGPTDRYINNGAVRTNYSTALLFHSSSLGTLQNAGLIDAGSYFAVSMTSSSLSLLDNSGTITGGNAIYLDTPVGTGSTISTLSNTGTISGSSYGLGVDANGRIGTLNNSGLIYGGSQAVIVAGTIGTLNNTGVIQSPHYAVYLTGIGSFGQFTNSGTVAGTIASTNDLTLSGGAGTQGTFTGNNGQVGVITLASGNLTVDSGSMLLNDNVRVGASHTFSNSGATLQVNNPLTIIGNYRQTANASLRIGVSDTAVATGVPSDSGYGRLIVSGNASIATGSSVGLVRSGSSYVFADGQRYVVLTAATNGTTLNESALNYSAQGFSGTLTGSTITSGSTSSLVINLSSSAPPAPVATTNNAVAALGGLANYSGVSPGLLDLFNASRAISSTAEANRVGEQLAPTQSTNAGSAVSVATMDVLNVVGRHMDSVRLAAAGGGSGVATGDGYSEWQAWSQIFAGKADQGTIDGVSGFNANYNGVVAGADRMFGDNWRAGAAVSYSGTWVKGAGNVSGNTSNASSWGLVGYASYFGNPWYVNLSGSVSRQNYQTHRQVAMPGYTDVAKANFNGEQYQIKGEFGYPLAGPGGSTVTPLTALSYSQVRQDNYTETSSNGSALKVGAARTEAIRGSLGGKIDKSWITRYGELTPFAQLMWNHQFNKNRMAVTSSYVADTTGETSFISHGATPVQDTVNLSLGVTLLRSSNLSLSARYDHLDGPHYQEQAVFFKVRKQF